ncbi:uncharacterized protein, partial [Triticum aestivum]
MARAGSLYIAGIECFFLFGRRCATAQLLCSDHSGLPSPRQAIQELPHRRLLCPRIRARAGRPSTVTIAVVFAHGRRISSSRSSCPATPALPDHIHKLRDLETDAAPVIDYVDDDPFLPEQPDLETDAAPVIDYVDDDPFLPEQPDAGVQEPDATVDDAPYYTGGAYYYVQPA